MADPEHIKLVIRGNTALDEWRSANIKPDADALPVLNLSGANFSNFDLKGFNLCGADLTNADLSGANLTNAILFDATLNNANLNKAILHNADVSFVEAIEVDFTGADLSDANFYSSDLCGARLRSVNMRNANFTSCDLDKAELNEAVLTNAILSSASLNGSSLYYCTNLVLDDNYIQGARFAPNATDPYSVIRRKYTGPMFFLVLILTLSALLPFAMKAISWSFVGDIEERLAQLDVIPNYMPAPIELKEVSTFLIVVGMTDEYPIRSASFTFLIVLYNLVRGWVTLNVIRIREVEERSHYIPPWSDYKLYFKLHHYILKWFFWLILVITAWRVIDVLSQPVFIPA